MSSVKPLTLLLAGSVLANAALVAVLASRSSGPSTSPTAATTAPAASSTSGKSDALRAALNAGDVTALQAAGISPDVARDLALGRLLSNIADRARANQTKAAADSPWWRSRSGAGSRDQLALRRELSAALASALGSDLGLSGANAGQLDFLTPDKRAALQRVLQDYDEMMAKFGSGGIQLASDKEKLRLLKAERDRDIAALLTPDEQLAYEMRTSPTANGIRNRYGDAIQSEADFRKIYELQKAFDDKYPIENLTGRISPETLSQRSAAQRQLQDDIRAALGDDQYTALRRASDGDLRNVDSLATRLNLPANTTDQVAVAREAFATESQRINADTTISAQQRRAQIQELADRARSDLTRMLGNEAGAAYAQSSPWMSMLQGGMAYSTTPTANSSGAIIARDGVGPSVYPVLPAGATASGMTRQVVVGGNAPSGDGARNVDHVMTFTSTTGETTTAPPASKQMIIVAPPAGETQQPKP